MRNEMNFDDFNTLLTSKYNFFKDNLFKGDLDDADFNKFCYSLALEQLSNIYILDSNGVVQAVATKQ